MSAQIIGINTTLVVIVARGDSLAHKFGTHKFGTHKFGTHKFGTHKFGRSAQIQTNSK